MWPPAWERREVEGVDGFGGIPHSTGVERVVVTRSAKPH